MFFLEERFSDWICMLGTFCSNGREVHAKRGRLLVNVELNSGLDG